MADDRDDTSLKLFNELFLSKYKSTSEGPKSPSHNSPSKGISLLPYYPLTLEVLLQKLDSLSEIQNTLRRCVEDIELNKTNTEKLVLEKDAQIEASKIQFRQVNTYITLNNKQGNARHQRGNKTNVNRKRQANLLIISTTTNFQ